MKASSYAIISEAAIILVLILLLCNQCGKTPETIVETKIDTIMVVDTVHIEKCILQREYHYDTIVVNDTVWIKDEPKLYTDSSSLYKLDINAVKLYSYDLDIYRRDTVFMYKETEKIVQKPKKFGQFVGIGAGVSYGLDPVQGKFVPSVGVSVVYGLGFYIDR